MISPLHPNPPGRILAKTAEQILPALALLWRAYLYSRSDHLDSTELAVELAELRAEGLGTPDLKWLIANKYARFSDGLQDSARTNHPVSATSDGRLALTDEGAQTIGEIVEACLAKRANPGFRHDTATGTERPSWDADLRVLKVGSIPVKELKKEATNQATVLTAFQELGWPRQLWDPLSPKSGLNPKTRLKNTIKDLNRNQTPHLVVFYGDGTGTGVRWKLEDAD